MKTYDVSIPMNSFELPGIVSLPSNPKGLVIFSHGSGSSRFSPRNLYVAGELNKGKYATLLFDLLSEYEDIEYENRFDINLLAERLEKTIIWCKSKEEFKNLPFALFGSSTGAAACFIAAAHHPTITKTIISRGGRPDLALDYIKSINLPTLFIVGEYDFEVLDLNMKAYDILNAPKEISIIPEATHLFEERGALEQVAKVSREWLDQYL